MEMYINMICCNDIHFPKAISRDRSSGMHECRYSNSPAPLLQYLFLIHTTIAWMRVGIHSVREWVYETPAFKALPRRKTTFPPSSLQTISPCPCTVSIKSFLLEWTHVFISRLKCDIRRDDTMNSVWQIYSIFKTTYTTFGKWMLIMQLVKLLSYTKCNNPVRVCSQLSVLLTAISETSIGFSACVSNYIYMKQWADITQPCGCVFKLGHRWIITVLTKWNLIYDIILHESCQ